MSFFSELPGKQDKSAELMNFYMGKLFMSLENCVESIDADGGKRVSLLVEYNSYDHDIYCVLKSELKKMQQLVGSFICTSGIMPRYPLGGFEMEKFPFQMNQVIIEIKKRLKLMGCEKYNVSIVTVPTFTHPRRGLFDKRADNGRIIVDGSCETIQIDLFW